MPNRKTLYLPLLAILALTLAGCGSQPKTNPNLGDAVKAAQQIGQDVNNADAVDSERNINNIVTLMNYEGNETDMALLKDAIRKGVQDGKNQNEVDKGIIKTSAQNGDNLGTGYTLGYTFGCKAATGDEKKCSDQVGQKFQEVMMEELQKQMPTPAQ
jgi:hypothetical protein